MHFDPTVSLGNLLTVLSLVGVAIHFGIRLAVVVRASEKRLELVENWMKEWDPILEKYYPRGGK